MQLVLLSELVDHEYCICIMKTCAQIVQSIGLHVRERTANWKLRFKNKNVITRCIK